jgi:transcriptional regulator
MYVPEHFRVSDRETIHDFIEAHSFATVVTQHDGEPFASHLPLLFERTAGPHGTIVGHLARANAQSHDADGQTALVIFTGPHAYVSPTWYAEPNTVPTWNYTAVHAYGRWQAVTDRDSLLAIIRATTNRYERKQPQPWQLDEQSPLVDALLKQIVGFRIEIERLEAKFKLNQNHSAARRERIRTALAARDDYDSQEVAALMR